MKTQMPNWPTDRLGHGRRAGPGHHPGRRHPHPPDRAGRRARHLQPPPRRAARRRNRRDATSRCRRCPRRRASFEIHNSPLSEYAALGFEFGYNVQAPERLVIWEAQYGDFINNAQTVIDEFIVSARDKWGQLPSLVLLLPHGYEGQGPDHSSGAAGALFEPGRRQQPARGQLHHRGQVLPPAAPPGRAARQWIRCRWW